jgi:L-iditol 2-dehydrogenase
MPDGVLIRVRACGICGSDVYGIDGSTGRRIPPIIMGHEAAGEIVEVGADVAGWKSGDRVTFDSTVSCGRCWYCGRGEVNLCEDRQVVGVSCADYRRAGAFAEYIVVPARILYRIPDRLSFEQAAMVEAVSVAVHAVSRTPIEPGSRVAVIGSGMIGLLIIQVLRQRGCAEIYAIDTSEDRLRMAAKFGATPIPSSPDGTAKEVIRRTDGRGADAAFEVVGIEATVAIAVASIRKGGSVVLVGNLTPVVSIPLQAVVTRQLSLIGTCASAGEYPECLELIASGAVDVSAFVSAAAPLEDGASWFERLYAGEKGLMKVLLCP